jgi:hypothetical protein
MTLESRSPWLLGRCSRHLREGCASANMVYSRAERMFILEHYFASKSFAAVREAFINAYSDRKVPYKITIHRLVTKFRDTGSVCDRKHVRRRTVLTDETLRNFEETLKHNSFVLLYRCHQSLQILL